MQVLKKQRAANEEVPPQKKRSDKQPMYVLSAVDNDIKGWVIFQALQRTNITKKENNKKVGRKKERRSQKVALLDHDEQ